MARHKKQPEPSMYLTASDIYGGGESEPMKEPAGRGVPSIIPGTSKGRSPKIKLSTAKAMFESLDKPTGDVKFDKKNKARYKKDKCTLSKKILKEPTVAWAKNFGSADVPSIDAPGKCTTRTVKGEKVTVCTVPVNAKFAKICSGTSKKGKGKGKGKAKGGKKK